MILLKSVVNPVPVSTVSVPPRSDPVVTLSEASFNSTAIAAGVSKLLPAY